MTDDGRDVRVGVAVASASVRAVTPAPVLTSAYVAPVRHIRKTVRTHVRTVVSVGASSISAVQPPCTGGWEQEGAVADVAAPFAISEVA